MKQASFFFFVLLFMCACSEHTPRPIGYNRIERAEPSYAKLQTDDFSFLYPESSVIDTLSANNQSGKWLNIIYPQYNARIYCTFASIEKSNLRQLLEDSHRFAYSHAMKADEISQTIYSNPANSTYGTLYDIGGSVATPVQFFLTDSVSHFFRASLYYDKQVDEDSIRPVTQFIKADILRMIESFEWTVNTKQN